MRKKPRFDELIKEKNKENWSRGEQIEVRPFVVCSRV